MSKSLKQPSKQKQKLCQFCKTSYKCNKSVFKKNDNLLHKKALSKALTAADIPISSIKNNKRKIHKITNQVSVINIAKSESVKKANKDAD